jgi:hypothetical protein
MIPRRELKDLSCRESVIPREGIASGERLKIER